jgi:hypothetical protein
MSEYTGLPSIWEDIKKYLVVSTVVEEAIIKTLLPILQNRLLLPLDKWNGLRRQ